MHSPLAYLSFAITFLLLVLPVRPAINAVANAAIQQAIVTAVNDGLRTVDTTVRNKYWAYLLNS